jgi:hypothetical protein
LSRTIRIFVESGRLSLYDLHFGISIPSSVQWIDGSSFTGCDSCEIRLEEWNRHFGAFLTNYDGTSLVPCFGRDSEAKLSLGVEMIGVGSFSFCDQLGQLDFQSPSKVQSIGDRAFEKCIKLCSMMIPPRLNHCENGVSGNSKICRNFALRPGRNSAERAQNRSEATGR